MSVRVMADVWDFGPDDPVENSVLVVLASHANDDGRSCFPSVARVAQMLRRSERTVQRAIDAMEQAGWMVVTRGVGRGNVSSYAINIATLKSKRRQADTLSEKGDTGTQKVTATTVKGDTHDKPPHPLIGVNVIETSLKQTSEKTLVKDKPSPPSLALFESEEQEQPTPSPSKRGPEDEIRERLFPYYLARAQRSAVMYLLTDRRMKKGVERLRECLKRTGDPRQATGLFEDAIDGLVNDPWNNGTKNGGKKYLDWIDHLCKSTEEFEKRLEAFGNGEAA